MFGCLSRCALPKQTQLQGSIKIMHASNIIDAHATTNNILQRVSTPFQPNAGVSGIDLSGGGCQGLPLAIRYSHPSLKKCDFSGCKSHFSRVSAAFQPGLLGGNEIKNTYTELFLELY